MFHLLSSSSETSIFNIKDELRDSKDVLDEAEVEVESEKDEDDVEELESERKAGNKTPLMFGFSVYSPYD